MSKNKEVKSINNTFSILDNDSDNEENVENKQLNKETKIQKDINTIEDELFNKYYKKSFKNENNFKNDNNLMNNQMYGKKINKSKITTAPDEGFSTIINKKREKQEQKHIQNNECEYIDIPNNLDELNTPLSYRILAHHNDDKNWDYQSYHNITTISKWVNLPQFFNTLNKISGECKYTDFDIFIMKNEIFPMWEDIENRNGSICSIKIDSLEDGFNLLKNMTYHMVNNTLLKFTPNMWQVINGISFSPKKIDHLNLDSYCVIIKIWFKINILNHGPIEKLLVDDIGNVINKYSIKIKPIKPEY